MQVNLTKYVQDLYTKNCEAWLKETVVTNGELTRLADRGAQNHCVSCFPRVSV